MSTLSMRDILQAYSRRREKALSDWEARRKLLYQSVQGLEALDDQIASLQLTLARSAILQASSGEVAALHRSLKRLLKEKQSLLAKNAITPDQLGPLYECEECEDRGFLPPEQGGEKCSCLQERLSISQYQRSNLAHILKKQNFSCFDEGLFDDQQALDYNGKTSTARRQILSLKQRCEQFVQDFSHPDTRSMLFYGATGLGKTFLCSCVAKALMDQKKSVLYYSATELFNELADTVFLREGANSRLPALVRSADLLIIDDLGSELTNSFVRNQFFSILNARQMNNKKILISTNLYPTHLQEIYEERIFSRMVMSFDFYEFKGQDLRWQL